MTNFPQSSDEVLAVIADAYIGPAGVFGKAHFELATGGHGLGTVNDDVQERLFHEVGVDAAGHGARGGVAFDGDAAGLELGRSQHEDAGDDTAQILILELELDGAREIDKGLNHAVESANFSSEAAAKKPDGPAPTIATW